MAWRMHDYSGPIAAFLAAAGVTWLAFFRQLELAQEILVGFGLGTVVGAIIGTIRSRRGRPVNALHSTQAAGLIGAAFAVAGYLLTEVR